MRDNTQASELFELCKEVYRWTKWQQKGTRMIFNDADDGAGLYKHLEGYLYTSDYLLEKLQPFKTEARGNRGDVMPVNAFVFVSRESKNEFRAGYRYNLNGAKYSDGIYADTPLKALLKLTIALSEAGELK